MKPLDEASQEVIRAGRAGEGASGADRERVRGKLAIALAAGAAGPAIAAPVAKAAAKWWASKVLISGVAVAIIGAGTGVVLSRRGVEVPPAPVVEAPVVAPVAPVAVAPTLEAETDEPDDGIEGVIDDDVVAPVVTKKTKARAPVALNVAVPTVTADVVQKEDTLEAETQGLREVHVALRSKDAAKALALIDDQDRRFPLGQLRPEREAAKVLALCASNSGVSALAEFVAKHPASPMLPRLRAACAR